MRRLSFAISLQLLVITTAVAAFGQTRPGVSESVFADWDQQQPGARHQVTVADLPAPDPQEAVNNTPHLIPRPKDAWPISLPGFKVTLYAGGDAAPMQRADNKQHMQLSGGTFTMPR